MIQIIIKPDSQGYHAYCPQLRGLHVGGSTIQEATNNAKNAVEAYLISMIKHNEPLPIDEIIEINLEDVGGEIINMKKFINFLFEKRFSTKQVIMIQIIVIPIGLLIGWLIGQFIIFK
jgi:predicted RNase H-like HicB family nuclease